MVALPRDFIQPYDIETPQTTSALILLRCKINMLNSQPSCQVCKFLAVCQFTSSVSANNLSS